MKKIILVVLMCLALNQNFAHAQTQRNIFYEFLANDLGLKNYALYTVFSNRCARYMSYFMVHPCQIAVDKMVTHLDSSVIFPETHPEYFVGPDYAPQSFIFVAFKKELASKLKDKETTKYLQTIREAIHDYLFDVKMSFNLWEETLKFYKSQELAAAAIATLFQDTSEARLHLKYFQRTGDENNVVFKQNLDQLVWTMESLKTLMMNRPEEMMKSLYPKGINAKLNGNIYHFYVPLHLNNLLKKSGVSSAMSYNAPLIMTLTYEFITAAGDYRYLFEDPKVLEDSAHHWKLKDIYASYLGVNFGSQTTPKLKQDVFIRSFGRDTYQTVNNLLKK